VAPCDKADRPEPPITIGSRKSAIVANAGWPVMLRELIVHATISDGRTLMLHLH